MPPKEVPQKKGKKNQKKLPVPKLVKKVKVPNPLFPSQPINQRIGGDLRV